jgi:hypothetical protein
MTKTTATPMTIDGFKKKRLDAEAAISALLCQLAKDALASGLRGQWSVSQQVQYVPDATKSNQPDSICVDFHIRLTPEL